MKGQVVLALALLGVIPPPVAAGRPAQATKEPLTVAVRGRAVCLDEGGRPAPQACAGEGPRWGFASAEGRLYLFLPTDPLTAMFTDPRVRERELQITARPHPPNRVEIIKIQSVRGGKLHDLYYFCDVCEITAYAPGPCPCCYADFEFKETPESSNE